MSSKTLSSAALKSGKKSSAAVAASSSASSNNTKKSSLNSNSSAASSSAATAGSSSASANLNLASAIHHGSHHHKSLSAPSTLSAGLQQQSQAQQHQQHQQQQHLPHPQSHPSIQPLSPSPMHTHAQIQQQQQLAAAAAAAQHNQQQQHSQQQQQQQQQHVVPHAPATRKKGDLVFKSNFESGNLSKVQMISEFEYELFLRPDTNNGQYRLWFYFSVSNVKKGQRVVFSLCNFSKARSLYRSGMTPLVKSESRPQWERIPEKYVYYYRSNRHSKNYVLSFMFMFDREDDVYYFAYCYPYTYTDLQKFLYNIEVKNLPFFKRTELCRTVQHRK